MNCSDVPPSEAQKSSSVIKSLRSTILQHEVEIESLKSLNSTLKSRLSKLHADAVERADGGYEAELLRVECSKLKREKEEQFNKNENLLEEVSRLRNENKNLKNENYSLQDENSNMRNENANLNLHLAKQKSNTQSDNLELRTELSGLLNENARIANKNFALQEEVENLSREYKEVRQERDSLLTELFARIRINNGNNSSRGVNENEMMHNVTCDWCERTIKGARYKCGHCTNYDLCSSCLGTTHNPSHVFLKIRKPVPTTNTLSPLLPQFITLPTKTHMGITCDSCGETPIRGIRFKCVHCPDFDACGQCESEINHDLSHVFIKFTRPIRIFPDFNFSLV